MWPLKLEPYKVQEVALTKTAHHPHGYAYFMEMGLGKTSTLLADFVNLKNLGLCDKLVVVAPFSLLGNWKKEVGFWTDNGLTVSTWPKKEQADVYLINYEAFAVGGATGTGFVAQLATDHKIMLALDESTQIKGNGSVRTRALLSLARMCAFTRLLSGAPMVQGPQDLWSQLKFIGELRGVNYFQYRGRYCRMGGYKGKQIIAPNPDRLEELNGILANCAFRAKKSDWLDLPDKTYFTRDVTLSPHYKNAYKTLARDMFIEYGQSEISAPMAITLMLKLQQISSGFIIGDDGVTNRLQGTNAKLQELLMIIENEVDTKVIIPVYFQESVKILQETLTERGIGFARILSKMSPEEIENEKRKFNEDDKIKVALAQTSSQKYGHTLLGTPQIPCFTTIFYENTFSLDDRLQMEDRNHRIGQRFSVNIIDLNCSPIEAKAIQSLQQKENVAKAVVDAIKTIRV